MNEIIKISILSKREDFSIKKKIYYTEETKESIENKTKIPVCENLDKKYMLFLGVDGLYKNIFAIYNSRCIILEYYVWSEDINDEMVLSLIDVVENEFKTQKKETDVNLENITMFKKNYGKEIQVNPTL